VFEIHVVNERPLVCQRRSRGPVSTFPLMPSGRSRITILCLDSAMRPRENCLFAVVG
jgi:hypothetical protein